MRRSVGFVRFRSASSRTRDCPTRTLPPEPWRRTCRPRVPSPACRNTPARAACAKPARRSRFRGGRIHARAARRRCLRRADDQEEAGVCHHGDRDAGARDRLDGGHFQRRQRRAAAAVALPRAATSGSCLARPAEPQRDALSVGARRLPRSPSRYDGIQRSRGLTSAACGAPKSRPSTSPTSTSSSSTTPTATARATRARAPCPKPGAARTWT